jgi:cobalt-zinc-cadmium efflux system membrane fusion protein
MKITACALLALLLAGCSGERPEPERGREEHPAGTAGTPAEPDAGVVRIEPDMLRDLRITTAPAEERPGGDAVSALGELHVNQDAYAEVGSPIPARVVRLLAAPGQPIRAGEPLAALESVELGRARAALASARAKADLGRQVLDRKRRLAADRIAPPREVEEAEAGLAAAEADLRAAESALRAMGVDGEAEPGADAAFALRAPLSGTVLERSAAVGRLVAPPDVLFRIGDLSTLWLVAHAFEQDALRVRPGAVARVGFTALPGRSFEGRVALVGSEVDMRSRTLPVRVEVENGSGLLRPGMSARAWLPLDEQGGTLVAVPAASVQRLRDDWVVFVPRAEGAFEVRRVGRGRDLAGEVEILRGLAPGETVVVEGAFLLKAEAERDRGEGAHDHH